MSLLSQAPVLGDAIYRYTLHIIQALALRLQQVSKLNSDYDEIKLILVRWLDPNLIKYSKRVFKIQNLNQSQISGSH